MSKKTNSSTAPKAIKNILHSLEQLYQMNDPDREEQKRLLAMAKKAMYVAGEGQDPERVNLVQAMQVLALALHAAIQTAEHIRTRHENPPPATN